MEIAYDYGVLMKPKVLVAMLALYLTTYFASIAYLGETPVKLDQFTLGFIALAFSVSGANAMNCIFDRDIDAVMVRTKERPLARGTITITNAILISSLLMGFSTILATYLGTIPLIFLLGGTGSYILLYTVIFKRRTCSNVLFTAPSVAAPAWFGWYLGGAPFYPVGFMMGLLVAIWGPLHLWSLAFVHSKDYERANIPMFTSLVTKTKAIQGILVNLSLLVFSSFLLYIWNKSTFYLIGVSLLNIFLVIVGTRLYYNKTKRASWMLFKFTSPYIILIFLLFALTCMK